MLVLPYAETSFLLSHLRYFVINRLFLLPPLLRLLPINNIAIIYYYY
jgi:hypothetical protein